MIDLQKTTAKKFPGINQKKGIMLHHTAGGSFESNMRVLSGNIGEGIEASTHYVLGENGEVGKIGEHNDILWHGGQGYNLWENRKIENLNKYYIGIEVVSDSTGSGFTEAQKKKLPELVNYIRAEENITVENVHRHADTSLKGKFDLNPVFFEPLSFDEWRADLENPVNPPYQVEDSKILNLAEMIVNLAQKAKVSVAPEQKMRIWKKIRQKAELIQNQCTLKIYS